MTSIPRSICASLALMIAMAAGSPVQAGRYVPYAQDDSAVFEDELFRRETTLKVNPAQPTGWRLLEGIPGVGALWVWTTPDTEELYIPSDGLSEFQLAADFAAPVGSSWPIDAATCNTGVVTLGDSGLTVQTPAGEFNDVIRLDLQPSCADAGVTSMWFAPGAGIIRVAELNIAGPRIHELIEADVGGVIYPVRTGIEIDTEFPPPLVVINREAPIDPGRKPVSAAVRLAVTNHSDESLQYRFRDGQRFDILVLDANGLLVSAWSRDMAFTDETRIESLQPGATWRFRGRVPLTDDSGGDLTPGGYTLRIEVTSDSEAGTAHAPGAGRIGATAPLEIN